MNKQVTGYRVAYFVFAFFISCFIVFSLHKGFQPIDIITIPVFAILLFLIIDFSAQYVYKRNLENFVTENFLNHRAAEISTSDLYEGLTSEQEENQQSSQEGSSQNTQIGQSPPCGNGFETCTTNGYCYYPNDGRMYSTYKLSEDTDPALSINGVNYWLRENSRDNLKCVSLQEEENDRTNTTTMMPSMEEMPSTTMMPSMEEMPTTTMMPSMEEMPTTTMMPSMEEMPSTTMMPSMEEMPSTTMMPSMEEMPSTTMMPSMEEMPSTTMMPSMEEMPTTTMMPSMEEMPTPPLMSEETENTTSSGMNSDLGSMHKSGDSMNTKTPSAHRKTKKVLSHQHKRPDINKHHMDDGKSGVINENTGSGNPININVSYNTNPNPSVKDMGNFTFDDGHKNKHKHIDTEMHNSSDDNTNHKPLLSPVNNTTVNTALSNMNQRYYPAYLENPLNKNQHGTQIKSIFENQMEKNRDANRNDLIRKGKPHWTHSNYESTMMNNILNQKCNPSPVLLNSVWSEWKPTD